MSKKEMFEEDEASMWEELAEASLTRLASR
jgi:hypothetical protein